MKKYFIIAVAALVALAACTKTEADKTAYEQSRVINFNTVTKKATKAPITGSVYTHDLPEFGVFAWYLKSGNWNTAAANSSAVSYMEDVEVAFDDDLDIWAPSDTYYWPLEGKLTFIAYSPKTAATAAFSNAGVLTLTGFNVNTTVADQVDLLYSAVAADKTQNESFYNDGTKDSETAQGDKGVNIVFKHALSQIVFKAKADADVYASGLSFKIDTIIVNAASTATNMTVTNPTEAQAAAGITTWNTPSSNTNFVASSADFPASGYLGNTLSDEIGDPLLMIPTTFSGTAPTLTVKYTLYRISGDVNLGTKEVTIEFEDIDDVVTAWQAGKKYEYDLTIDLQKIYFTPSITDWDDETNPQPVDVPDDADVD